MKRRRSSSSTTHTNDSFDCFVMALLRLGVLLIACFFFVVSCLSSSTVQGTPVNPKFRSSEDGLSRQPRSSNAMNKLFVVPTATLRGRLYSRTGYFLEILKNGTVQATMNNSSEYTKLEMQSYNKTLKRFKGILSQNFLACELRGRKRGRFIGRGNLSIDSLFVEHMEENHYLTYRPFNIINIYNNTGYLAIKSNGKFRRVERAEPGMYASQFTFLTLNA